MGCQVPRKKATVLKPPRDLRGKTLSKEDQTLLTKTAEQIGTNVRQSLQRSAKLLQQTGTEMKQELQNAKRESKRLSSRSSSSSSTHSQRKVSKALSNIDQNVRLIRIAAQCMDKAETPTQRMYYVKVIEDAAKRTWRTWDKVQLVFKAAVALALIGLGVYAVHRADSITKLVDSLRLLTNELARTSWTTGAAVACGLIAVTGVTLVALPFAAALTAACWGLGYLTTPAAIKTGGGQQRQRQRLLRTSQERAKTNCSGTEPPRGHRKTPSVGRQWHRPPVLLSTQWR
jgi:hypothetical protein